MKRADHIDIKSGCLLEQSLYLRAVFSDDAYIVASCLIYPRLVYVKRAEFTESVCGEEHLVCAVVGNDDLGPMHHRRGHEVECVTSELKY